MALVPMQDYVFFLAQFQNVRAMKRGSGERRVVLMALVPMQECVFFLAQFRNVRVMKKGEWGTGC